MPPGRPIVADVQTNSSNIARLVEFFLSPLAKRLPSFLLDSQHLIAVLRSFSASPDSLLCTFDVRSLYTNVPINEGIQRVSRAFLRHPDPKRPDDAVLELLRLFLVNNDFLFQDQRFLQVSGVAMGKCFGGSFANLYLGEWESIALSSSARRPRLWLRFQDDIFAVWDHGVDALQGFLHHLNSLDPNIQVDLQLHSSSIRFLDLEIYRSASNRLSHRIGFKDTASHQILPSDPHHPSHVHNGVVFSQILRWATRSSTREDFDSTCHTVLPVWRSLGVSRSALRSSWRRVLLLTGFASSWSPGFRRCRGQRCGACSFAAECDVFKDGSSLRSHAILFNLSCSSTHCIYVVRCSHCQLLYVGQSSNPLRQRIGEHLRAIRRRDPLSPLVPHFSDVCDLSSFSFFAIDRCLSDRNRLNKESRWIKVLNTLRPHGLNCCLLRPARIVNLVTHHADCTSKLNNFIKDACRQVTDISVRLSYRRDRNLYNVLR